MGLIPLLSTPEITAKNTLQLKLQAAAHVINKQNGSIHPRLKFFDLNQPFFSSSVAIYLAILGKTIISDKIKNYTNGGFRAIDR